MLLDVLPGHEIGEAVRVEADEGVDFRPFLYVKSCTDQWRSRYSHISIIYISLQRRRRRISFMGFDCTFFFMAQTPSVTMCFFPSRFPSFSELFSLDFLDYWLLLLSFYKLEDFVRLYIINSLRSLKRNDNQRNKTKGSYSRWIFGKVIIENAMEESTNIKQHKSHFFPLWNLSLLLI